MTSSIPPLTAQPAWKALGAHYQTIKTVHLRDLFADDPQRGERMTLEAAGVFLDYSKNLITEETLKRLPMPTLLITGEADLYSPPALIRRVAAQIPNSEVVIVREAGHSSYWEQPDEFNRAVLDFLARHSK